MGTNAQISWNVATCIEGVFLFYMFFLFKTRRYLAWAPFEEQVQEIFLLKHPTFQSDNRHVNRICPAGKILAMIAIVAFLIRIIYIEKFTRSFLWLKTNIVVVVASLVAAFLTNFNALLYIIPICVIELAFAVFFWIRLSQESSFEAQNRRTCDTHANFSENEDPNHRQTEDV